MKNLHVRGNGPTRVAPCGVGQDKRARRGRPRGGCRCDEVCRGCSNYNLAAETRLQRFHDGHEEVTLLGAARGTRGRKTFCLGSYEGVGFGVGSALPCVHFYSEELDYIRAVPGIRSRFTRHENAALDLHYLQKMDFISSSSANPFLLYIKGSRIYWERRHPLVQPSSGGCKPKTWVFESGGCSRLLTGILSR